MSKNWEYCACNTGPKGLGPRCSKYTIQGSKFCTSHAKKCLKESTFIPTTFKALQQSPPQPLKLMKVQPMKNTIPILQYNVSAKIVYVRGDDTESKLPNPTKSQLAKYMKSAGRLQKLAEELSYYYRVINGSVKLKNENELHFMIETIPKMKPENPTPNAEEVKSDLQSSVEIFSDTCYGGNPDNHCHYPNPFGEIDVRDIKVQPMKKVQLMKVQPMKIQLMKAQKQPRGCVQQNLKKYTDRPSPPFPANECCGRTMAGKHGRQWISIPNKSGICRWVPIKV